MSINDLFNELKKYTNVMDFNKPISPSAMEKFESDNGIIISAEYKELLRCFNGGEIFIPGTVIFGVEDDEKHNIRFANRGSLRKQFCIPNNYLIFAIVNYGDFLCINLNSPYDVIQWDHENDEEYCNWASLAEWLNETIAEYRKYNEGEK